MEIEELVSLLGLDLPRVLGVNMAAEWGKHELERLGWWPKVRSFGFVLPIAAAVFFCLAAGEEGLGALQCGVMYGIAAIALHEFHDRI